MASFLLPYHPPYHWESFLKFLSLHLTKGIETIQEGNYCRAVHIDNDKGWLLVSHKPEANALELTISPSLNAIQDLVINKISSMFDIHISPEVFFDKFRHDPVLSEIVAENPGVRVPGAFDGFELAVRAILGQQISVKAATTLAGRLTYAFGTSLDTPFTEIKYLPPTPHRLAALNVEDLTVLGVIKTRAGSIIALSKETAEHGLELNGEAGPQKTIKQLIALPGIGDWTAHYIAMRALHWPDAFLKNDLALRQALGGITATQSEKISQAWRPWRSYATMYLWQKAINRS